MAQQAQYRSDIAPAMYANWNLWPLWGGLLGMHWYSKVDPTDTLRATPGYNWMMDQGTEAIERKAAGKGMLSSGPAAKSLLTYGQGLADQTYNKYMDRLYNTLTLGQNAIAQVGSSGTSAASSAGNALIEGGKAADQAEYYNSQNSGSGMSDLMGGLGLLGSLALTPITGGASAAAGAAGSGTTLLGKLWNGGASWRG